MTESTELKRGLKQRHLTMIAIGGVIGAGLFVGSGVVINETGPAAFLSYLITGVLIILVMRMLGEMATANPTTGSFADYLLPSAADLPTIETGRTETPATTHPLGVKGVGEAGTIASTPAIVNAIVDALRPRGVNDVPMPCTPERVWRAANAAEVTA